MSKRLPITNGLGHKRCPNTTDRPQITGTLLKPKYTHTMNQKQQQIEELSKKFLEEAIAILGTCNVDITFKRCNRKDIIQMDKDLNDPDYPIGWYSDDVLSGHAGWWASPPIQDNEINICYDFD